jgi:hypothetical protein
MLGELDVDQAECELSACYDDRSCSRELPDEERQRADVVFMSMRQNDGGEGVGVGDDVLEVGNDEVDAEHFVIGKPDARVNQKVRATVLKQCRVLADLANPPEKDDTEGGYCHISLLIRVPSPDLGVGLGCSASAEST